MLGFLCLVMCFATPSKIKSIVTILGEIFLFPERVVGIRYIFALLVQTFDLIPYTSYLERLPIWVKLYNFEEL